MVGGKRQFFLGVGAPRSGTTWLYKNIRASSDLYLPPVKELRFFKGVRPQESKAEQAAQILAENHITDEDRGFVDAWCKVTDGDVSQYLSMFPGRPKIGEISPIYSTLNSKEIAVIREVLEPLDAKVFYMLRNPFLRDISHIVFAMHRLRNRKSPYSVEEYRAFVDTRLFTRRSNYQRNVRVWRSAFRKDFRVFYYDELDKSPKTFFHKFATDLGLDYNPDKITGVKENKSGHQGNYPVALPKAILHHLRDRHEASIPASKAITQRYKKKWLAEIEAYFAKDA
ncbi:MAG: sulfotransferase [Rhodobacteraceae bacterium]|nr:sulfotransferase [Paracoccaceae bacterium]